MSAAEDAFMSTRGYQPLNDQLAAQAEPMVTWTFAEIGRLLGRPLPPAAYTQRWWQKRSTVLSRALGSVGWRVTAVDAFRETVTFVRVADTERPAASPNS